MTVCYSYKAYKHTDAIDSASLYAFWANKLKKDLSKKRTNRVCECTLKTSYLKCVQDVWDMWSHYADTPRAACFLLYYIEGSAYEGILKSGIEVKAVSDKCLARSVAVT